MNYRIITSLWLLLLLGGCSSMATQKLAGNLVSSMLNQDDPATVRAAIPAYLVLLDGLIKDDPDNTELLISASRLYGAFAKGLEDEPVRSRRLVERAKNYARTALCIKAYEICQSEEKAFSEFVASLDQLNASSIDVLYAYATSYADWISVKSDDWNALMYLPKVEAILQRIVSLEPGYANGRAQLYLAVMHSQLPSSLGGKPETGRNHFELALQYSQGRDFIAKVEYARTYARLVFDRPLHDRLLNEVINTNPVVEDLTLSNIIAQQKAQALLNDDYF